MSAGGSRLMRSLGSSPSSTQTATYRSFSRSSSLRKSAVRDLEGGGMNRLQVSDKVAPEMALAGFLLFWAPDSAIRD
jgi:hypothetical protein